MILNKQMEKNVADALIEKPLSFTVGADKFCIYPATLGKMQLLRSLYLTIDVNMDILSINPLIEALRVCMDYPDIVCQIIAYSTFNDKYNLLNEDTIIQRASFFKKVIDKKELAVLMVIILTNDKTEEFIKYFGIDVERKKRMRIGQLKGEGNSITFGGKSIYGLMIDFICQRYGWTLHYVLWEVSLLNLEMLLADTMTTVYLSDEERKKLGIFSGDVINADDPKNSDLVRTLIGG